MLIFRIERLGIWKYIHVVHGSMQFKKKFISEPFYGKNQLKFNDAIKGFTELMKKTEHNPEIYPYHSITTYYVLHISFPHN